MENSTDAHYVLGARIMTLMATASTDTESRVLKFALQELHNNCPPTERPSSSVYSFNGFGKNTKDLRAVQTFFDIT